jgi:O-methyltransferase
MIYKALYSFSQVIFSPISILTILNSKRIHPAYKLTALDKLKLGFRMYLNKIRIVTGTHPRVHLAMALKLLEIPPSVPGIVLECGTWKGGTAANLSLICKLVGRQLLIYDSFEGLPAGKPDDRYASYYQEGEYCGTLVEVKRNIARYGAIEQCTFVKGWFDDTLPKLDQPIILAYLDVDLEASLHTCVRSIWPHLSHEGFIFIDECTRTDYCALFYSEMWWDKYFRCTPPGLVGAGTGLPLGDFYIGPSLDDDYPLQHASTGAYTGKTLSGYWSYYPPD